MAELSFEIYDSVSESGRRIQAGAFSRNWDDEAEIDDLLEQLEDGQISVERAITQSEFLLKKNPDNLEINNFLGSRYWDAEMREAAGEIFKAGYHKATKLIPKTFKGRISWSDTDNRSFLRVAYGYLLSLMHQQEGRQAMALANKLLKWCPNDNLGVRYLVGDIKMMCGDYESALRAYLAEAENSPISWYSAALIVFRSGDYVRACTYLRKGIVGNPYVAEALTGRLLLADHLYWHGSNVHSCEFALDYLEFAGQMWAPEECDFIDWVFNSAAVLRERAAGMEIHEALTAEHDFMRRGPWVERWTTYIRSVNDQLSKIMVQKIKNRRGHEIWPWDRIGLEG